MNHPAQSRPLRRAPIRIEKCVRILILGLGLMLLPKSFQLFAQSEAAVPLYLNPKQPVEVRVEDLLSRMTLKGKVG